MFLLGYYEDLYGRLDDQFQSERETEMVIAYNKNVNIIVDLIPEVLNFYQKNPPKDYSRQNVGNEQLIAWNIMSSRNTDYDSYNYVYLLSDGGIFYDKIPRYRLPLKSVCCFSDLFEDYKLYTSNPYLGRDVPTDICAGLNFANKGLTSIVSDINNCKPVEDKKGFFSKLFG